MNFLERLAADPLGSDPNYRLVQKREWCSFRGQTLLRTVRGMMYYERAVKILSLLELAKGSHWTSAQEKVAKAIAQRKFQYVLSCKKKPNFNRILASDYSAWTQFVQILFSACCHCINLL
jgi:callose synthase